MRKVKAKKLTHRPIVGRDPKSQLYRAVRRYVESHGGSLLVIGGVQVEQWPHDRELCFGLVVRCMGRKPKANIESRVPA